MKTFSAKHHEVQRNWLLVDGNEKVVGRLASQIALRLRGKHKAEYTPHVDTGDYIVVVNAAKLRMTGNKSEDKTYYRHSGYPGGVYETNFKKMQERFPGSRVASGSERDASQGSARVRNDQEAEDLRGR